MMDSAKIGRLIQSLRKEKHMTQREIALFLNVSEQAVSKWERGIGCPDISLLGQLSRVLGVDIEKMLTGELGANDMDNGSIKRIKFYTCKNCNNVVTSTGETGLSCCGRILEPHQSKSIDEEHKITLQEVEDDYYVTLQHEMSRDHYITFLAYVSYDRMLLIKLYPEQNADTRIPRMFGGTLYFCCSEHGLFQCRVPNYNLRNREDEQG